MLQRQVERQVIRARGPGLLSVTGQGQIRKFGDGLGVLLGERVRVLASWIASSLLIGCGSFLHPSIQAAMLSSMIFPTKTLHAVRTMIDLAQQGKRTPLKYTAERVGISKKYAEQIISELQAAGLVKSIRGRRGGYLLARPAGEISIGDVVRAVDNPHEELRYPRDKAFERVQRAIWERLDEMVLGEAAKRM